MRLLGITDLHGRHAALERILDDVGPTDVVLLGGDITHFGSPSDAEKAVRLARASGATVLAVAGNCDSAEIEQRLAQLGVSLDRRGVVHEAIGFHGLSATPPWGAMMHQSGEEELAAALEVGYAQVTAARHHVVLAHVPPHGLSLDRTFSGQHVGSTALREFVHQTGPCLVVCGHIHEGRGVEQIGQTTIVNCGHAASGQYVLVEVGDEVRIVKGVRS